MKNNVEVSMRLTKEASVYEMYKREYNILANAYLMRNTPDDLTETLTDIVMKNFRSLVKSTAKTQEVLSKIYPKMDSTLISNTLKDLKNSFKGNNDNFKELLGSIESKLSTVEKGYSVIVEGISTDTRHEEMKEFVEEIEKSIYRYVGDERVIDNDIIRRVINNPYLLAEEYIFNKTYTPETIVSTLLSFASRGYSSLNCTVLLCLEASIVRNCISSNPYAYNSVYGIMNYDLIRNFMVPGDLFTHLSVISSIGSFQIRGKTLYPVSIVLDTVFTDGEMYIGEDEVKSLLLSVYGGDEVDCDEILSHYLSKLAFKPESKVKEENKEEEKNMENNENIETTNVSSSVEETLKDIRKKVETTSESIKEVLKDERETFSEAASEAYDNIVTEVTEEVSKENSKTKKVLIGLGIAAVCVVGGILGYKYFSKEN